MRPSDSNKIFNVALRRESLPTPAVKGQENGREQTTSCVTGL